MTIFKHVEDNYKDLRACLEAETAQAAGMRAVLRDARENLGDALSHEIIDAALSGDAGRALLGAARGKVTT